jgi:hypothetical protein
MAAPDVEAAFDFQRHPVALPRIVEAESSMQIETEFGCRAGQSVCDAKPVDGGSPVNRFA